MQMLSRVDRDGRTQSTTVRYSSPAGRHDAAALAYTARTVVEWIEPPETTACIQRTQVFCVEDAARDRTAVLHPVCEPQRERQRRERRLNRAR
ncbi:hypothetical protein ABXN37_21025 [Piscinibacter sakaiensis]|uniref:hypothetical protein n=1 Tax=Piscinibacter sakaiensis TaxID=1547922 RepID=UPI00372C0ECA